MTCQSVPVSSAARRDCAPRDVHLQTLLVSPVSFPGLPLGIRRGCFLYDTWHIPEGSSYQQPTRWPAEETGRQPDKSRGPYFCVPPVVSPHVFSHPVFAASWEEGLRFGDTLGLLCPAGSFCGRLDCPPRASMPSLFINRHCSVLINKP